MKILGACFLTCMVKLPLISPVILIFVFGCEKGSQSDGEAFSQHETNLSYESKSGTISSSIQSTEDSIESLSPEQLVLLLTSSQPRLSSKAFSRLNELGPNATDALLNALSFPNISARRDAARLLGSIHERRVSNSLRECLADSDQELQLIAAISLASLKDHASIPFLINSLEKPDPIVRRESARGLRYCPDERSITALKKAINDEDVYVRMESCVALYFSRAEDRIERVLSLLSQENNDYRVFFCRHVDAIADSRLWEIILSFLSSNDEVLRHSAAYRIGVSGGDSILEQLHTLMKSQSKETREAAGFALGFLGDSSAGEHLKSIWNIRSSEWARVGVALGLSRLENNPDAIEYLHKAIFSEDINISLNAIQAIGIIGKKESIENLICLLKSGEKYTGNKRAAIESLNMITGLNFGPGAKEWVLWYNNEWRKEMVKKVGNR